MKTSRAILAALVVAALSTSARAWQPYSELRQRYASIDPAVDAMPNSGLQGDLNHLSAVLSRPELATLPPGSSALVPDRDARDLVDALDRVADGFTAGRATLSPDQEWVLLQVLDVEAVRPVVALYSDVPYAPCAAGAPCANPAPIQAADRLVRAMLPALFDVTSAYNTVATGSGLYPPSPPLRADDYYQSQTIDGALDDLRSTWGALGGVENIDG